MTPVFIPGAIYQSKHHGLCEFKRVDEYMGQRTLEFVSLEYGKLNVLPSALGSYFEEHAAPKPTPRYPTPPYDADNHSACYP